jgi:hypothetical protein
MDKNKGSDKNKKADNKKEIRDQEGGGLKKLDKALKVLNIIKEQSKSKKSAIQKLPNKQDIEKLGSEKKDELENKKIDDLGNMDDFLDNIDKSN